MQLPPLSVLQSLPAPNYVNPETHPPAASIVNLVLYPLCVVVMVLRAYSRIKVSHSFGADDALAISAMVWPQCRFSSIVLTISSSQQQPSALSASLQNSNTAGFDMSRMSPPTQSLSDSNSFSPQNASLQRAVLLPSSPCLCSSGA